MGYWSEFNAFVRWLGSDQAVHEAQVRAKEDLYAAYAVAGTILLAGLLVIGSVLAHAEPSVLGKKDRAKTTYGRVSVEKEAYIR